jgi:choline dehydrogenase-like flavoprotein
MRSFRFVESNRSSDTPRHFAHFVFDSTNAGFLLAKAVLSGIQTRRLPSVSVSVACAGAAGLANLAYCRYVKSRLHIASDTRIRLQLDVEQSAPAANSVRLGDSRDRFGRPVPEIRWQIAATDVASIESLSRRLLSRWASTHLGGIELRPWTDQQGASPKPHDVYHPVGTCRMGLDSEATVDLNLRVRGTKNLFLLSTALFPSAGSANPTFGMLCLGDRLAGTLSAAVDARPLAQVAGN